MLIKQHNMQVDGSDLALAIGDRQYAQDKFRDFWHLKEYASKILEDLVSDYANNIIINGCIGSQGAGHTLSWTAGRVKVPHTVKTPTDWSALPPPMTSHTIPVTIDIPAMTNQSITGATTDGVTVNYAKFTYNELGTSSRQRAKKAGTYDSEINPTYTFTCNSTVPTANEIAFATFTSDGATLTFTGQENRWNKASEYDFVVRTANDWKYVIERTGANTYQFKSAFKSVYFKYLSGGYLISDILSGGDTWGVIKTNNCSHIVFESGAYINVGDTASYLESNTDDFYHKNIWLKGTGSSAVAVAQSFLLNANRGTYENCKTSNRLSSSNFAGFQGSSTPAHNYTSKYIGCGVYTLDTTTTILYGFKDCWNLDDCYIYDLDTTTGALYGLNSCSNISNIRLEDFDTTTGVLYGLYFCNNISNCNIEDFDTTDADIQCISNCNRINNCYIYNINAGGEEDVYGFHTCQNISNSRVYTITVTGSGYIYGFYLSEEITSCIAQTLSVASHDCVGFKTCKQLTSCKAFDLNKSGSTGPTEVSGFSGCARMNSCYAYDISGACTLVSTAFVSGFNQCTSISSCTAEAIDNTSTGNAYGFKSCSYISSCNATNVDSVSGTAEGFNGCGYGSSLYSSETVNTGNDWIDTVDATITNKVSTPSIWT